MMLRKILFWTHLTAGVLAGLIILLMCVTGVALMYERQIIAWADGEFRSAPPASGAPRLAPEAIISAVSQAASAPPASVIVSAAPTAPVEASMAGRVVYFDAYSGAKLGEGDRSIRSFFRSVTDWHRWLSMQGPQRPTGRAITGASNLIFFFIVLSGLYLWLPRRWNAANLRAVLLFRGGLAGRARDFNWHNVIGFWCAVPLAFIVLGGLVISYPWATNLVYRLTGTTPAPPASAPAGPRPGAAPSLDLAGLNTAWARATEQVPHWQTVTFRPPAGSQAPFDLVVAGSHRGRPDLRYSFTIDRANGTILKAEQWENFNTGRRVRMWLRFIHTGEALGVVGQTIAGMASAGGAVLVWTGLSLAWRRLRSWQARRSARQVAQSTAA